MPCRICQVGSFAAHDCEGQALTVYIYQVVLPESGKQILQLMTAWGAPVIRVRKGRYLLEDGREFLYRDPSAP